MQAISPFIAKFGIAALLPGQRITILVHSFSPFVLGFGWQTFPYFTTGFFKWTHSFKLSGTPARSGGFRCTKTRKIGCRLFCDSPELPRRMDRRGKGPCGPLPSFFARRPACQRRLRSGIRPLPCRPGPHCSICLPTKPAAVSATFSSTVPMRVLSSLESSSTAPTVSPSAQMGTITSAV